MEIIHRNIFDKAAALTTLNYEEKSFSGSFKNCTSIVISHDNKTFHFSTRENAEHIQNLA